MSVEEGLRNALVGVGLRVEEQWPNTVNMDVAIIHGPLTTDEIDFADQNTSHQYEINVLMSLGGGVENAHKRLVPYLLGNGRESIKAALYQDMTLGGEVSTIFWRGIRQEPARLQIPGDGAAGGVGREAYGASVLVEVYV